MPLADAISTAVRFVTSLYYVYLLLIFVYILLSWIPLPYNAWLNRLQRFLYDVVNPYISLFRRLLPQLSRGGMGLDFTPILAVFALIALNRILIRLLELAR